MSRKNPSAGDSIESRCTRCRTLTNHIIVAMVEDKVARVQCNTCGGIHNYHAPKEEKVERVPKARPSASPKAPRESRATVPKAVLLEQEQWLNASRDADPVNAVLYRMDGSFKVNSWISHPTFGFGLVLSVVPNKVEILFQEGKKLLRSAN